MGQKVATLEVELAMATGQAIEDVVRFGGAVDKMTAQAIRDADKIEQAIQGATNMSGATAQMVKLADETAKAAISSARDLGRIERAGEALVAQLDRQTASFGKSRLEILAAQAATAALAAEQAGMTELAERLRAKEQELWDVQYQAARRQQQAEQALAEERDAEAARAAKAAEVQATAVREAAAAYQMFEARVRAGVVAMKEAEAAAKAATMERQAQELRDAAFAYGQFEAAARKGIAAMKEAEAAERAASAEKQAQELREAAFAYGQFEAAARKGMQAMREADAAAEAEAREIANLRARLDPAGAAAASLAAQLAKLRDMEARGAISAKELADAEQLLTAEHNASAVAGGKNAFALKQVGLQLPDIFQGLATGQKPMQVFLQQGGQIVQIAMLAEGGIKGLAVQIAALAAPLLPVIVALGALFGAFKIFQAQVKNDGDLTRYRDGLGLTHKEMLQLSDGTDKAGDKITRLSGVTVTFGDVMAGLGKTIADGMSGGGGWSKFEAMAIAAFKRVLDAWNVVSAGITAGIYGTFDAAKVAWGSFPAVFGDLFVQGVNAAIGALNRLVKLGIDQLNTVITTANKLPGVNLGTIAAPQIAPVDNAYAGAAAKAAGQISTSYSKAYADARKSDAAFWAQVGANARQHAKDRMDEEAAAIKADRTPKKSHEDKHAETLAREAAAEEAQIKNLGLLAAAYDQSGAAALIAEAREKAESKAIKDRGDIEAEVSRQVRLAIAQRIADAAKATASMNDQAAVQERVNGMVEAGLLPQAAAAQMVQQQIALLPLLAAQQAAQQIGDQKGYAAATKAIADQTAAQQRLNKAKVDAAFDTATKGGDDELARLRLEISLIGQSDAARVHALATLKATQDAEKMQLDPVRAAEYVRQQVEIADQTQALTDGQRRWNEQLGYTADAFEKINETAQLTGQALSDAFGKGGKAAGDALQAVTGYYAQQSKLDKEHDEQVRKAGTNQAELDKANADYQRQSTDARMSSLIGLTTAAKGFFKENSAGYKAMETAEKALTLVQLARTAVDVAGGAAKMFAELGPWAFPAVAAMIGVMASLGFSGGGSGVSTADYTKGNTGTGTVLGDTDTQSASIKNAISALKDVDDATLTVSRGMLASLQSIDSNIGGLAKELVKAGDINADAGIKTGTSSTTLSGIVKASVPLVGTFLGGVIHKLFGTKTTIVGNGLYGASQSVGDIIDGGFDASYYSDVEKKKKFFGVTTSTKLSTQYSAADSGIEDQFTLLIKQFYDTIGQAAGPLGQSLDAVQSKLQGFTVDIGKIDLKGLTGDQIEEKLEAVFGAAADDMANAAFPGIEKFQKVGEGAFETLVRVSSTVEQVDAGFQKLGVTSTTMGVDVDMAVAGLFDSVSDFTSAADTYFQDYYTKAEQATAGTSQIARAMSALGLAMPDTLDGFRDLVQAQDLTTDAGQQTYATLLQLAPAFYDLKTNLEGAKSAADIVSEQQDLQNKLWELVGDTADIRAAELAKLDPSNRALQEQIYAITDAQDAAKAASDLADAWKSVGDSIMDEINRIRGLSDATGTASFAQLQGQFNAATEAARAGDQTAAQNLPTLSKSLLDAAATAATSRQELDRVQAETAASLQATYDAIAVMSGQADGTTTASTASTSSDGSSTTSTTSSGTDLLSELVALRAEVAQLRADNNSGHATTAANTGKTTDMIDKVTRPNGGSAITVTAEAA
jgi:hypothetical protein